MAGYDKGNLIDFWNHSVIEVDKTWTVSEVVVDPIACLRLYGDQVAPDAHTAQKGQPEGRQHHRRNMNRDAGEAKSLLLCLS